MSKRDSLTRLLAILGSILVWLPLLAPILLSLVLLIRAGIFHFDYLMPAELFFLAWVGGGVLIWASFRSRLRIQPIAISTALMVFFWFAANGVALATGLASGRTEPAGLAWILVIVCIVLFTLSVLATAILGLLLLRDVYKLPLTSGTR